MILTNGDDENCSLYRCKYRYNRGQDLPSKSDACLLVPTYVTLNLSPSGQI